jgi:predicted DNA-binding transcriptional regulator AlpA
MKTMALISLEQAASQLNTSTATLKEWVRRGLLTVHTRPTPAELPPGSFGFLTSEEWVEEAEVAAVAERLAWLQLSHDNWDDSEEN